MSHIFLLPQADGLVAAGWIKKCYEPDWASEFLLHDARLAAAPTVKQQ